MPDCLSGAQTLMWRADVRMVEPLGAYVSQAESIFVCARVSYLRHRWRQMIRRILIGVNSYPRAGKWRQCPAGEPDLSCGSWVTDRARASQSGTLLCYIWTRLLPELYFFARIKAGFPV